MKYSFTLILFTLIISTIEVKSQKVEQFNSWWTYAGDHKISDKFGIHTLYSFRRNDFVNNWQQSLLRGGINYHYSEKLIATVGYDWVETFPYGEQPLPRQITEQRIFEQLVLKNNVNTIGVVHRYRLEQRFIETNLLHRMRYRLGVKIPLIKNDPDKIQPFILFFDEIFLNFGDIASRLNHYFDQNWIFLGIGIKTQNGISISAGYMNQYIQKPDNMKVESNHTLNVGLKYDLDLRRKN